MPPGGRKGGAHPASAVEAGRGQLRGAGRRAQHAPRARWRPGSCRRPASAAGPRWPPSSSPPRAAAPPPQRAEAVQGRGAVAVHRLPPPARPLPAHVAAGPRRLLRSLEGGRGWGRQRAGHAVQPARAGPAAGGAAGLLRTRCWRLPVLVALTACCSSTLPPPHRPPSSPPASRQAFDLVGLREVACKIHQLNSQVGGLGRVVLCCVVLCCVVLCCVVLCCVVLCPWSKLERAQLHEARAAPAVRPSSHATLSPLALRLLQWSELKKSSYVKHAVREYEIHKALRHPR